MCNAPESRASWASDEQPVGPRLDLRGAGGGQGGLGGEDVEDAADPGLVAAGVDLLGLLGAGHQVAAGDDVLGGGLERVVAGPHLDQHLLLEVVGPGVGGGGVRLGLVDVASGS